MHRALIVTITISFVALAGFGFMAIANGTDAMPNCIAAAAVGHACPNTAVPLAEAAFHLSAFKIFSTALVGAGVMLVIFLYVSTITYRTHPVALFSHNLVARVHTIYVSGWYAFVHAQAQAQKKASWSLCILRDTYI